MRTYIKLAWRNIWRNKRRTLITAASIFFAIFFALIMRSMQIGSYDHMINNVVRTFTGYIHVQAQGYEEDKTINNTLDYGKELKKKVSNTENVKNLVPRLQSYALGAYKDNTKGVMPVGIDPETENRMTGLKDRVIKGEYLEKGDNEVLVASRLADFLEIEVGDTLVMLGQGYHGVSAAGKYPVKGILEFPTPDLDNKLVFMNLPVCQEFFSAYGKLSSLVLDIEDRDELGATISAISEKIDTEKYEVMSWRDILTQLVQQIKADNASGLIMLYLLYLIIAFGVFGTVLMMIAERKKEFGVMVALGLKRTKLSLMVFFELLFIGIIGTLSGAVASLPVVWYFHLNPIRFTGQYEQVFENFGLEPVMPFAVQGDIYINQIYVVFIIILVTFIYPLLSLSKLNPISALRT